MLRQRGVNEEIRWFGDCTKVPCNQGNDRFAKPPIAEIVLHNECRPDLALRAAREWKVYQHYVAALRHVRYLW